MRDVRLKEKPGKHAIGNFPGCNTTLGDLLLVLCQLHLRANQSQRTAMTIEQAKSYDFDSQAYGKVDDEMDQIFRERER